jgi:predicted nucleic acid-binding protein
VTYLLDTNVLSEVQRPRPDGHVLAWLDQVDEDRTFLSVVTVGEIARGGEQLEDGRRKATLRQWLDVDLAARFGSRLLPIDRETALAWGSLMAGARAAGRGLGVMDAWIAACALRHGLTLVTRNTRDFVGLEVDLLDPWTAA